MNEKDFLRDLWDLMRGNTIYITQDEFKKKYDDLLVQCDESIRLADEHNEWHLALQKVWCDETQC